MSKKTWKDHLLSSGVPLEYSVIRIFEELGIRDPGEYRYERATPDGLSQVFSVDVHAKKVDPHRDLHIECLVECKYRHDGTKWIPPFLPCQLTYGWFFHSFKERKDREGNGIFRGSQIRRGGSCGGAGRRWQGAFSGSVCERRMIRLQRGLPIM
jgi:hypothetical protein